MKTLTLSLLTAAMLITAAWAAAITHRSSAPRTCLTAEDVAWFQNHSVHGISQICNENRRQWNLARLTAH